MSLLSSLKLASSRCNLGTMQKSIFKTSTVLNTVSKQSLYLTPASSGRIYGPSMETHSDTPMWRNERIVAMSMIPLIPLAIAFPSMPTDFALSTAMVIHCHWRLSGVCEDYIHGELLPRLHQPLVMLLSILAFGSLCYLNYADVGFATAVRMLYGQL